MNPELGLRRSPFLVTYWENGVHWVHHYLTGRRRPCSDIVFDILQASSSWTTRGRLSATLQAKDCDLDATLRALLDDHILQASDRPTSPGERALEQWESWNPAAGFFHAVSKQMRPGVPELERYRGHPLVMRHSFPATLKQLPGERFPLPPARAPRLQPILRERRTWREFGDAPVALDQMATLLGLTFGVQEWLEVGDEQWVALKSSPSGGARHSVEAYLVALDVAGLDRGTYHYCPDTHALKRLDGNTAPDFAKSILATQPGFHRAAALVILTSVFGRMQWKYPHPHAYRVVLMDAGHLSQTFALLATELGLAPFCTAALDFTTVETHLGIDGVSESALLLLGVGQRPAGKTWSPMHDGSMAAPRTKPPTRTAWPSDAD